MTKPSMPGADAVSDTLDFVKNLWGGMGVPGMAAPTLSVDDLDKRITDLKAVEAWLALNSQMVRGTIQALEVQRGTLAALKSMGDAFAKASAQPAGDKDNKDTKAGDAFASSAAWWNMLQEQFTQAVNSTLSPEAMAEAGARAQEAASKMAAGMPDVGKPAAQGGANGGGKPAAKRAAKPKAE